MNSLHAAPAANTRAAVPPPPPRESPPAAPVPDPAELERLRLQARDAGWAQGHREGLAHGHAKGHAAGLAAGQAVVQAQAERLRQLAEALPDALRRVEAELARSLVALALDVARQVVHHTLESEPHWVLRLVQELLRQQPTLKGEPRLLLHPDDLALVAGSLGGELQAAGWQLRADDSIARGGCLVQADTGTLDATLETRCARVSAALAATLE